MLQFIQRLFLLLLFIGLLPLTGLSQQNYRYKGHIVDAETNESLPFVNIRIQHQSKGTMSGLDGHFEFNHPQAEADFIFSYVGYKTSKRRLKAGTTKPITISLQPETRELDAVVVVAGENPAHIILRKAIENRKLNDHTRLPAYRYVSYNKLTTTTQKKEKSDTALTKKEKIRTENGGDSLKAELDKHLANHHLFMSESIIERKYRHPGKLHETVLASRTSGYKDPLMTAGATNFKPLTFYDPFIPFFEQSYASPITRGSTKRYYFELVDTLLAGTDSIYVITFTPKEKKGFYGLTGTVHIHTDQYAIQYIRADFHDPQALMAMRWEQTYEKVNQKHWFPVGINMSFQLQKMQVMGNTFLFNAESLITQINFPEEIPKNEFGIVNMEISDSVNQRKDEYWNQYRQAPLSKKEENTYQFLDSVSQKSGMYQATKWIRALMIQRLAIGKVDLMIDKLLTYNSWEGLAPGIGFSTNQDFSKFIDLTAWMRYGIRDNAFKYGARLRLDWNRRLDFFTALTYRNDLAAAGQVKYDLDHRPWGNADEGYRTFFAERMESVQEAKISSGIRLFNSPVNLFTQLSSSMRRPLYPYAFGPEKNDTLAFRYTEATVGLSYYHRERFISVGGRRLYAGYQMPTVNLLVTKGVDGLLNGQYNYWRADLRFRHQFNLKGVGRGNLGIYAGKVWGNLPYSRLYSGRADGKSSLLMVANIFQTAGYYEFAGSEFVNLFYSHNFGRLIHRSKYFRPELILAHYVGFSKIRDPDWHHEIEFQDMRHGFHESGLLLENLVRVNYFDVMYLGFGGGLFYRHGHYQLPKLADNLAYKIAVKVSY